MQAYLRAWRNFARFEGRANRLEYSLFVLINRRLPRQVVHSKVETGG